MAPGSMAIKPISIVALAAAALLVLTGAHALSQRAAKRMEPTIRVARSSTADTEPAAPGRCAIQYARFGGERAQLVRVIKDGITNYVVMEVGRKRDPLMRFVRNDWLRVAYGDAQRVWLGGFGSGDAAMKAAAKLCPPSLRCWPGDTNCGREPGLLTPIQIFSGQ
jgi:hypothetical protein